MEFPETFSKEEKGIFFHTIDVSFSLAKSPLIISWLINVVQSENRELGAVHFYFCSDDYQLTINKTYLEHDDYTDIISFQYDNTLISGDIFISIDRVKENSMQYTVDFETEFRRVLVHGILHFIGFSDKTPALRSVMRQKEDTYLKLWDAKSSKTQG